ncbi:hypothetical protein BH23GEM6_BH23GEM6_24470 [soil metagenome]
MKKLSLPAIALAIALTGCADPTSNIVPDDSLIAHAGEHDGRGGRLSAGTLAQLAQVRRATAQFHNIDAAMAAGYTIWSPNPFVPGASCATSAEGKMGYHLVNPSLRGSPANPGAADAVLDPLRPEMLLYEKRRDGKLHLVGVEYLVFKAAWEREHGPGAAPPQLLGQTVPFSSHTFPPSVNHNVDHYELHLWLWKPHPNGMFSPWNPSISC